MIMSFSQAGSRSAQTARKVTQVKWYSTMSNDDLEIELGGVSRYECPCCRLDSCTVHGFLYESNGKTSVYFAGYTHGHPKRCANLVLSVGGWGEGTTPADRKAIAMQAFLDDQGMTFTYPPSETSPWYGEDFLGVMSSPEQLSTQDRARSQELARTVVEKDPRVAGYFELG